MSEQMTVPGCLTKLVRVEPENICPACNGEGSIYTGIAEWSHTQCNKCDGTGLLATAPIPSTSGEAIA